MRSFRIVLIIIVVISGLLGIGFFYASSPAIKTEDYALLYQHNNAMEIDDDSIITLLTYNIGYLSGMTNNLPLRYDESFYRDNLTKVLREISEKDIDIAGFQEIDYGSRRSYYVDQHNEIADSFFAYSARAVNWDKRYVPFPYWPPSVHFGPLLSGQSVVSKYPLTDHKRIVLEKAASNAWYYKAFYLDRLLQIVSVKHPHASFVLMNLHAEAFDASCRSQQLDFVLQMAGKYASQGPVILMGDFNSDPHYEDPAIMKFFECDFLSCAGISNPFDDNVENTYPSDKPAERLDYVFYTHRDFEELDSDVVEAFGTASDHLPLMVKLKFKGSK